MTARRATEEPDLARLATLWRKGKLTVAQVSEHLGRRQIPLFPEPDRTYRPVFTPAEQEQLTLFQTEEQRQLRLSLVTEVKPAASGKK